MPTGYTADLHDGKPVTFEQFVLKCSRAMGAAIMQRDESPDVEIRERVLDDHYIQRVEKAAVMVHAAVDRTLPEWEVLQDTEITKAEAFREKYLADKDAMRTRYESMLEQIRAWVPPTSEHQGLKDFMVEQIESSIRFDCSDYLPEVQLRLSPDIYAANEIARLAKEYSRDAQYLAEERDRVAGQNAWVRQLRASLGVGE